jgi:hypothetical protein
MSQFRRQVQAREKANRVGFTLTTKQVANLLAKFDRVCVLAHGAARALKDHDIETAHDRLRTITCLCGSRLKPYTGIKGK